MIMYTCSTCGKTRELKERNGRVDLTKDCHSCAGKKARKVRQWGVTHGGCHSVLYGVWCGMKNRCHYKANRAYQYYGGRGIGVCAEWLNDFGAFRTWAESRGYEKGLILDRRNNDLDYSPDNCRWVTPFWSTANRRGLRLCAADAFVIKDLLNHGVKPVLVGALYQISPAYVSSIKNGHAWARVEYEYAGLQ
jgi:hypothetical protein